ncbi:polyprenyl synthetase family protein [Marinicrinis sediminis]|uniref:Polyprenyl synthetase family protein n=1 Tax=Marinicrinis sediminis TaxID=1652465 RepID=A0ABW5RCJ5_9BACL
MTTQDVNELRTYLQQTAKRVEDVLIKSLPQEQVNPILQEAMAYSLQAGGKRMRPIMTLTACEAVGGNTVQALPAAAAIEMIHTYSLIHDDLPAMDNDDYRRGKLTNHKVYGEAMAILAGDGLLTHAFHTLVHGSGKEQVAPEVILQLVQELSAYAGPTGMVGGQAYDLQAEKQRVDLAGLNHIHTHKTGDLIVCSLRAGAMIGGANPAQLAAISTFGYCIGLAFQIQDDILDVTGDEKMLGKKTNSDEKLSKSTYPQLLGIEKSKQTVQALTDEGKQALMEAGLTDEKRLLQLADFLVKRES